MSPNEQKPDWIHSDFFAWPKNVIFDIVIEAESDPFSNWLYSELTIINTQNVITSDYGLILTISAKLFGLTDFPCGSGYDLVGTKVAVGEKIEGAIGQIDFRMVSPNRLQVSGRTYLEKSADDYFLKVYKSIIAVYPLIKDNSPAIIQNHENENQSQIPLREIINAIKPGSVPLHPKMEAKIQEWFDFYPDFPPSLIETHH